jgi:hypothetical protein
MDYISGYPFTLVLVYVVPVFTHGRSMRGNEMPFGRTVCERMSDGFIEGGIMRFRVYLGFHVYSLAIGKCSSNGHWSISRVRIKGGDTY